MLTITGSTMIQLKNEIIKRAEQKGEDTKKITDQLNALTANIEGRMIELIKIEGNKTAEMALLSERLIAKTRDKKRHLDRVEDKIQNPQKYAGSYELSMEERKELNEAEVNPNDIEQIYYERERERQARERQIQSDASAEHDDAKKEYDESMEQLEEKCKQYTAKEIKQLVVASAALDDYCHKYGLKDYTTLYADEKDLIAPSYTKNQIEQQINENRFDENYGAKALSAGRNLIVKQLDAAIESSYTKEIINEFVGKSKEDIIAMVNERAPRTPEEIRKRRQYDAESLIAYNDQNSKGDMSLGG